MVVLTNSDVRAYCLGIAQLIPVLVIAISVLDNNTVKRRTEPIKQRSTKAERQGRKELSGQDENRQRIEKSIKLLDDRLAELDRIDLSQADEDAILSAQETRVEIIEARTKAEKLLEDLSAKVVELNALLDEAPVLRQELDKAVSQVIKSNTNSLVYSMFLGIAGEILALWGAVGLLSGQYAIAWSTNISIVITGYLSIFAVDRLMSASSPKFSRNLRAVWFTVILAIGQVTFALILFNVKVVG
jgi:hypothetical protein